MKPGEFHWTDGWYFLRMSDGSVRIQKRADGSDDAAVLVSITVPSMEWVSIIAHLAPGGEPSNFGKAVDLHLMKFDIAPAVPE